MKAGVLALATAAFFAAQAAAPVHAQATTAIPATTALPATIPSGELVESAKALDGRQIVFEGEAIGDPMPRGEGAWVNVSDGAYAIGVWLPRAGLAEILHYGSYAWRGDRLRVKGTFRRACPEHGGDLDIHATSIEVVERGAAIAHRVSPARILAATLMSAAGAVLLALWRKRESGKKHRHVGRNHLAGDRINASLMPRPRTLTPLEWPSGLEGK